MADTVVTMSDSTADDVRDRHPVTSKRLVVRLAHADRVAVRAAIPVASREGVTIDLYDPPGSHDRMGSVILVNGLPDPGARRLLGCAVNEMASFTSWARAIAASGLRAVTYTTTDDPAGDLPYVVDAVRSGGVGDGLDGRRCALWACSSHVPNALGLLLSMPAAIQRAVLCYGFMLDLDGSTGVAHAQRTWRFANPAHGRRVNELPPTPLFVVRAGQDTTAGVNDSIDSFARHALASNLPLTLVKIKSV
jgi:hypothetical protein